MTTFKNILDAGNATREMLDDLVDEWHSSDSGKPLYNFLGYSTLDQYGAMLQSDF